MTPTTATPQSRVATKEDTPDLSSLTLRLPIGSLYWSDLTRSQGTGEYCVGQSLGLQETESGGAENRMGGTTRE